MLVFGDEADNVTDPEGDFVEAIGRNFTADQAAKIMVDHIKDWEKPLKKVERWQ
jgi:protein SCO1